MRQTLDCVGRGWHSYSNPAAGSRVQLKDSHVHPRVSTRVERQRENKKGRELQPRFQKKFGQPAVVGGRGRRFMAQGGKQTEGNNKQVNRSQKNVTRRVARQQTKEVGGGK